MLSILERTNGAQVEQFLKQIMIGHNLHLEPGFYSAINKGIFVYANDYTVPKHFTALLTQPISDEIDESENNNELKLAVQNKWTLVKPVEVDLDKINFFDILWIVDRREYHCKAPY